MALIRILLARRHLALLICAAALALKLVVPGGYMIAAEHGRLAITVCPGVVPASADTPIAMAGMHGDMASHGKHDGHKKQDGHGQVELPCAFAGLSHQALGAVDAVLLAGAIAFVMARGTAPAPRPLIARVAHLRPPLRGPPAAF